MKKHPVYVFMDCRLILKQEVFFLLSHHKEEKAVALQAFTGHCLDLSQSPASRRLLTHSPTHCIPQLQCTGLQSRAEQCESSCTVNQPCTFPAGQELAGTSGSSLGMLLPRVQPYHT